MFILAGWVALTLYTLALPFPTDGRSAAAVRGDTRAAASAAPAAPRARAPGRKAEEGAAASATTDASTADNESGLAALFRRAINASQTEAPQGEASGDSIKP